MTESAPSWQEQAACRGVPLDLFYSFKPAVIAKALEHCTRCPVVAECLGMADRAEADDSHVCGIFGGLTAEQRRQPRSSAA